MAEQDDDVAEALAYLQDMQDSNHEVAKMQWGWAKKYLIKKALRLLKKYINRYPFVRRYGRRLFC